MHLEPGPGVQRPFQRAARRIVAPIDARRRQDRRRLRRQLQARPALGDSASSTCSIRAPACRGRSSTPPASPTCAPARSPRSAPSTWRARTRKVLGHIGARGTAYWNVRLLDQLFDFDEIRVHSRRPESRERFRRDGCPRSRQEGHRDRGLGELRRGRRHRGRGLAAAAAAADAEDRMDQARRASSCPMAR